TGSGPASCWKRRPTFSVTSSNQAEFVIGGSTGSFVPPQPRASSIARAQKDPHAVIKPILGYKRRPVVMVKLTSMDWFSIRSGTQCIIALIYCPERFAQAQNEI